MTARGASESIVARTGTGPKPLVGFLGPRASYSHQATLQAFPEDQWDLQPLVTIPDIFTVVQSGSVSYGVVPFENSTNGSVLFTLDCFADRHDQSPDIAVCGEIYLDVHHYLIGRLPPSPPPVGGSAAATATAAAAATATASSPSSSSSPSAVAAAAAASLAEESGSGSGTCTPTASDPHPLKPRARPRSDLSHIQRIYSHPQAWGQCSAFLQTYLKAVEAVDVSSTSRAAELVAEDETGTSAAISSRIAAELHGVDILAANIEDREDNTTRFFVIRKAGGKAASGGETRAPGPGLPAKLEPRRDDGDGDGDGYYGKTKSMVSFMVPHEAPGALADVLECFRSAGLNLTSINSRPSLEKPFQYVFFVEFKGHRLRDPEGRVKDALEGIAKVAEAWRWLGSWDDRRV